MIAIVQGKERARVAVAKRNTVSAVYPYISIAPRSSHCLKLSKTD
jgi:hypothetical protein